MTLDEKIVNYITLQQTIEEMQTKLNAEKAEIIALMELEGKTKVETEHGKATIYYRQNIKYSDETEIIKFCEDNGYSNFITKKVNTTALNKELKKGGLLKESLNPFVSESETKVLKVEA